MSNRFIDNFNVILLDQGKTFMFENDRFGPDIDYYTTYQNLAGELLAEDNLREVVNKLFDYMLKMARDPSRYDLFLSVPESLSRLPECRALPAGELRRLDELVALHETGTISEKHIRTIKELSETHRLGIVSNIWGGKYHFERNLKEAGIYGCFDCFVWSSDYGSIKPSPKIFEIALRYFNVESSKILFVGDHPIRDVSAAKSMGMSAVWIKNRDAIFPDDCIPPDLTISDLNGLIAADQGH